jgi:hypothetical protein
MFEDEMKPIWWLPTVGFFLFIGIVSWMFFNPDQLFEDPGVGRHLRTAEFILETGQIPHTDPLSFTRVGEPWTDFEWAFEATLGQLYRFGGLGLISAFCFTIFAATVLNVFRMLVHSNLSTSVVMLYTGLAFLTIHLHFAARPVLFTYLFMALVVEVWHRRTWPLKRDWLLLPIVFAAWANIHAGWLAALVFLGGSIVGRTLDRIFKRTTGEDAPIIPWIGLTLLCLLATWFNPWGWDLHRQVILFATTYKSFALWDEYRPPNFVGPSMSAVTVIFILLVLIFTRFRRGAPKWSWEAMLPILFFLFEGLKAQRHVILLVVVAAIPIGRDLEVLLHGTWWPSLRERLRDFQANQRLAFGDAWLALVAALVLTFFFLRTPDSQQIEVGKRASPRLVAFLRDHPDRFHRPLTTTWNAGPLLWNMRPDFRVSFDDRGDFYGDKTVFAFVDMSNGLPGWRETFDQGHYDSALLDPYLPLNKLLPTLPGWKEVYRDKTTVVYWKDAVANP